MSDNLVINPHAESLNFLSLREAVSSEARATKQSSLTSKNHIRSSSFLGTNMVSPRYSFPYSGSQLAGRVEPQLNTYFPETLCISGSEVPSALIGAQGGFDLDSFRSGIALNQAKIHSEAYPVDAKRCHFKLQYQETRTLWRLQAPAHPHQGRGRVRVELVGHCRKSGIFHTLCDRREGSNLSRSPRALP